MRFLFLLLFLFSSLVWAQEIPYDMPGCQRHFARWARVEKVQVKAFQDAFPETIWEGDLVERLEQLQAKWPNNIKIVDDVKFRFKNNQDVVTSTQKKSVVIVSTEGLTEAKLKKLKKDYTNAVSWLTVSHPLSEGGGHLYTRVGNKTVDYYGSFNKNEYELSTYSERIEPIINLTPEEQFRLNTYVKNANKDREGVLGENSYDGASDSKGTLKDNTPKEGCGGHNCTSWMGLAPIGDDGQALVEITGGSKSWNIHTNPGWWLQHLTGVTSKERVSHVFYFTPNKLTDLERKVKKNNIFDWNWGLH